MKTAAAATAISTATYTILSTSELAFTPHKPKNSADMAVAANASPATFNT